MLDPRSNVWGSFLEESWKRPNYTFVYFSHSAYFSKLFLHQDKSWVNTQNCAPPNNPQAWYTNDLLKEIKRKINLISNGKIERYQYLSHGLRCLAMGEWEVKSEDLPQGSIDLRGMSPGSLEIPPFNGIFPLPCVHFSLVGASSIKTDSPLTCIIKY